MNYVFLGYDRKVRIERNKAFDAKKAVMDNESSGEFLAVNSWHVANLGRPVFSKHQNFIEMLN